MLMTSQENKMAASRTDAREIVQQKYHFSGANSLQKLEDVIFQHEKRTNSLFVKVKTTNKLKLPVHSELVSKKRVFWEEHSSQILPLPFDGVPFIVVGRQVRECSHGPDRHKSAKCKSKKEKEAEKADHDYDHKPRCNLIQTSKKLDCPAKIIIRSIVRFPDYKIDQNSEWGRRKQSKQLCADLRDNKDIVWEYHVYVALPPVDAHKNHLTNEIDCITHNVDKRVIKKIHSLVDDGVRDTSEMNRHVKSFSKAHFPFVPDCSNRFFPNKKCLQNHMYSALTMSQFSTEDQDNLQQNVNAWKRERPDDYFYFVPSSKEETQDNDKEEFLFVHQSSWQRRLLSMYGSEICLLDATYCVCKFEIEIALERVKNIISMKNRDAPWMKRHCSFRKGGRFLKRGFGFALFSQQALFFVEQCLLEHFFTDTTGLAYSRHGRVIGMEDEAMIRIFQNDRYLAQNYIKEVCVREALLSIVSKTLKLRYSESEVLLTDTEDQSVIVALESGFKKCKMNKEKWCGKLDSFKESKIIA